MRIKFALLLALVMTGGFMSTTLMGCGDKDSDTGEEVEDLEAEAADEEAAEEEGEE